MTDLLPVGEEARVAEARVRLAGSIGALQKRIAPKALAQTAMQGIVDKGQTVAQSGVDAAKKNPLAAIGALSAMALFFARRPIAKLLARGRDDASPPANPKSIHSRAAKRNAR